MSDWEVWNLTRHSRKLDTASTASAAWKAKAVQQRGRIAELEVLLLDRETDLGFEYDRANDMEQRVAELEEEAEQYKYRINELSDYLVEALNRNDPLNK